MQSACSQPRGVSITIVDERAFSDFSVVSGVGVRVSVKTDLLLPTPEIEIVIVVVVVIVIEFHRFRQRAHLTLAGLFFD
jgi:hypothetical protein